MENLKIHETVGRHFANAYVHFEGIEVFVKYKF